MRKSRRAPQKGKCTRGSGGVPECIIPMEGKDRFGVLLVDCGSRASRLYYCPDDSPPDGHMHLELGALHDTLAGEDGGKAFVTQLHDKVQELINAGTFQVRGQSVAGVKLFVGATAGMRDALNGPDAELMGQKLAAFTDMLKAKIPRAEYSTLLGTDEAHYEYTAVEWAVKQAVPSAPSTVNMISMGGGSVQLGVSDGCVSIQTGMRTPSPLPPSVDLSATSILHLRTAPKPEPLHRISHDSQLLDCYRSTPPFLSLSLSSVLCPLSLQDVARPPHERRALCNS